VSSLASLLLLLLVPAPQGTPPAPAPAPATGAGPAVAGLPDDASPSAREAWRRVTAGARLPGTTPPPISAFDIEADVLTRNGVQSNQFTPRYRFLHPDFVRFRISTQREAGKGPGAGRAGYWLRDGDEVQRLSGRSNAEDRRLVDDMLALSTNFVSLTDPGRLRLTRVAERKEPSLPLPTAGLRRLARKLAWLEIASPDFALLREERASLIDPSPSYVVQLGLDRETWRPALAILSREARPDGPPDAPLLFELGDYRPQDQYFVPHKLLVRRSLQGPNATPTGPPRLVFEERPWQEIFVLRANLAPGFTAADFEP
jgi:hypothetical protein